VLIDATTRAIVTGASKGIGRATAFELARRGARLGLLARGREALDLLADELPASPQGPHVVLVADISKRGETEKAIERFAKRAEGLDLLVANAGLADYAPFVEQEIEAIERMVAVNVLGTIWTVRAALGPMLDSAHGHVVILSSGSGLRAFPWGAVYGATKAADRGFAEALRHELSGTGVDLTTVMPGEVETDLHAHELERLPDWRRPEAAIPPERVAEEIVAAVIGRRREVHVPAAVRLLGLNGVAPKLTDSLLRRVRGPAAAPRRG
jgi:short-subunit dehydrogenase